MAAPFAYITYPKDWNGNPVEYTWYNESGKKLNPTVKPDNNIKWKTIDPCIQTDATIIYDKRIDNLEKLCKELKINWKKIMHMLKRKERKRILKWYGKRMFA